MRRYFVYILTNDANKTIYIGVTNNLERRIHEHKSKLLGGFTAKYNLHKLVYFEETSDIKAAIEREKQLKGWLRVKKTALISKCNPSWRDLSTDWSPDSSVAALPQNDIYFSCHPEAKPKDLMTSLAFNKNRTTA